MSNPIDPAARLELLHEHYKESFALIRERERQRDRLLLVIIGLYAVLILAVGYPAEFGGSVSTLTILGTEVTTEAIPTAALLSALWVFTAVIVLRYCQLCVSIERNYSYVHDLENAISGWLGDGVSFCREGKAYLNKYPPLLNLAWRAYGYGVPLIVGGSTVALVSVEWNRLLTPLAHKWLDTAMGAGIILVLVSYRVFPTLHQQSEAVRNWFTPPKSTSVDEPS